MTHDLIPVTEQARHLSHAIELWLKSKADATSSERTALIYQEYIHSFRDVLHTRGYDLDGQPLAAFGTLPPDEAIAALALAAQAWASTAQKVKQQKQGISASTYNQRLAVLSSFYTFARKRRFLLIDNPLDLVDRRKTQEYASARPFSPEELNKRLQVIDRTTEAGKRDYALILVFVSTGRRAKEVLSLQWKDVRISDGVMTLHFHCKGNKELYDKLEPRVNRAMFDYLQAMFPGKLYQLAPEQCLWLSFSHKRYKQPLTQRGLADIFKERLGMMKVHSMRHTFAHSMAKTGASVLDIQARLGHSNVATTGRYLQQLNSDENKYASRLLDFLGVEE